MVGAFSDAAGEGGTSTAEAQEGQQQQQQQKQEQQPASQMFRVCSEDRVHVVLQVLRVLQ